MSEHPAVTTESAAPDRLLEESERKGRQLCEAVDSMMLACQRLAELQGEHVEGGRLVECLSFDKCHACSIPLPDLSDEGVEKLVRESNESFAELLAAAEARGAEREREEPERLRAAIAKHRSQKADDRCVEDDDELYAALGDGITCDRRVGDKAAMLANCRRFIERRCEGGGWPSYADLESELERSRVAIEALKEWRAADVAVLECLKVPREERAGKWDAAHTAAVNRRIDAVEALRAAADALPRAVDEGVNDE